MEPEFWHARWEAGQLGFHQADTHDQLKRHGHRLAALTPAARVLVPLCGKSLDMRYLRALGYEVVGVELSPIAARDFFAEAGQTPEISRQGALTAYTADGITILCGDMFDATPEQLGPVHAVYDRAALVALPPDTRRRYAVHLASLVPTGGVVLLVSFEYPQTEMSGPPFCVPPAEIAELFGSPFELERLEDDDLFAGNDDHPFRSRLSRAREQTYLLTKR